MNPLDLLAIVIVALVPLNVAVAGYLVVLTRRHPDLPTLRERAGLQVALTVAAAIGGYFGMVRLLGIRIGPDLFVILLAAALLLVSYPGVTWAIAYIRDGFE